MNDDDGRNAKIIFIIMGIVFVLLLFAKRISGL
jgi:hypothetical protein